MSNRDYYGDAAPQDYSHFQGNAQQSDLSKSLGSNPNEQYYTGINANDQPTNQTNDGPENERGLGATVVGGAGGAFFGHKIGKKLDHGGLGAVGGALAGAVVANMASNAVKGHHHHGSAHGRRRDRLERRLDRVG